MAQMANEFGIVDESPPLADVTNATSLLFRAFLHSYIPTCLHAYMPTFLHSHIPTLLHSYTPTFLHSYQEARDLLLMSHLGDSTFLHSYIPTRKRVIFC